MDGSKYRRQGTPVVRSAMLALLCAIALAAVPATGVHAASITWTRQFGTPRPDSATDVDVYSTGVYVAGYTDGALPGQTDKGGDDAFVRRYNRTGGITWTRQFGSPGGDQANSVAVNSTGVYVVGQAYGALPGQSRKGDADAFVRKYTLSGNHVWTRQFGTAGSDYAWDVDVDSTGVYVVGHTTGALPGRANAGLKDAFIRKYSIAGGELWTRQFGSSRDDYAFDVAVNSSGVYVVGTAAGALPGGSAAGLNDAFVRRYTTSGGHSWTRQFGTAKEDWGQSVAVDSTGIYVDGYTRGALPGWANKGSDDGFVRKYNSSGGVIWTRQFGGASEDLPYDIGVDSSGVYITGWTHGALPGQTHRGEDDVFIRKYSPAGSHLWTTQFGTPTEDYGYDIDADSSGVYLVGYTDGTLPGQTSAGLRDAFLRKYTSR